MSNTTYSSLDETRRILDFVLSHVSLPLDVEHIRKNVTFTAARNYPYFPIPFKEMEVTAALKAIEGSLGAALADLRKPSEETRHVTVNLEKTTAFLFQAYLATVGGLGKLDPQVKALLKGIYCGH